VTSEKVKVGVVGTGSLGKEHVRIYAEMAAAGRVDFAGVYDVIWVLRKDGRHTRFTDSEGDCSFLNFDCRSN